MSSDWSRRFPAKSGPRPVAGGLIARSTRGEIGEHWWSRRFVEVLESFALGSRLTRGKNYARRGQVLSLEVKVGSVTATVQGSRRSPYHASISLAPFSALIWAKVEVTLAEQAIYSAQLLAGELPPELEQVFAAAGAPLFPQRQSDLQMSCSCPDYEVPCKHLSAVFYLLAERFDDDPFQILHWRGRDRATLLGRLRTLRGDVQSEPDGPSTPGAAETLPAVGALAALADLVATDRAVDRADPVEFWTASALPSRPVHPELPPDLVLRQLPVPDAGIGGASLVTALRPLYARMAESQE
jgi:uncharacterized Zn finger protein